MYRLLATLALLPVAFGHFILNYPTSLGFDDDNEGNGPCGGFPVSFSSNDTEVTVDSFAVALMSTHPQAQFLYRVSLQTEEPFNWTNIVPIINEYGIGNFCLPALSVPSSFAGHQGVIQVIQDAADGVLYQCAAVNFVNGTTSSVPSQCVNASGVTATLTSQTSFSNASTSGSATISSATATATKGAAVREMVPVQLLGGLLAVLPVGFLLF